MSLISAAAIPTSDDDRVALRRYFSQPDFRHHLAEAASGFAIQVADGLVLNNNADGVGVMRVVVLRNQEGFDLQPLDCNFSPTTINAGSGFTTRNHLASNPSNGAKNANFVFRVYLSTNADISSGDTLLSTQNYNRNFGAFSNVTVNMAGVTIPAATAAGVYYVGVIYDSATDFRSSNNDTDNWDAVRVTVRCKTISAPSGVAATPPLCGKSMINSDPRRVTSGIKFAGRVSQLITASTGFDDWEWGVTLWGRAPEYIKEIVYTMRFDRASARYAEFGPFYLSYIMPPADALAHLKL